MYKETLRAIAGIGLFPVISLLLFVMVFMLMVLRAIRMDRAEAHHLAGLPLEGDEGLGRARQEVGR